VSVAALAGLTAVQARVAQLQAQFDAATTAPTATATSTSTSTLDGAGAGSSFASALSQYTSAGASGLLGALTGTGASAGGTAAVALAEKYLGVPYVYGGSDPSKGLDCSGLVQLVYRQLGVNLPRTTYEMVKLGTPVDPSAMQPGDLVFSVGDKAHVANGHVGIYAGNGMYVVAPHTGDVVKVAPVPKDITAVRRLLPAAGPASGSASPSAAGLIGVLAP
jgi:cell wall-associated NlpC family hydrolase